MQTEGAGEIIVCALGRGSAQSNSAFARGFLCTGRSLQFKVPIELQEGRQTGTTWFKRVQQPSPGPSRPLLALVYYLTAYILFRLIISKTRLNEPVFHEIRTSNRVSA